jgi:hypothetical protein
LLNRRHEQLGAKLCRRRDNDPGRDRIELVGRVPSAETGKLRVVRKQFRHALLQFGYLRKLAKLGFVLVEVGIEDLRLVH